MNHADTRRWELAACLFIPLVVLPTGCGEEAPPEPVSRCGPNGVLHRGPGVEPHCDCDDGYVEEDGLCVWFSPNPEPNPMPSTLDCGMNGTFNGRACSCNPGYTQTGLGDQRTCEAIPACQGEDDSYEPNDAPENASLLAEVEGALFACPADADWYVFPVTAGDRVSVEILFDGANVDLDLLLFGPSSPDPVAFSLSASGHSEAATFIARMEGTAGILVAPYGLGEGTYQLSVDVQAGEVPMCSAPGAFCQSNPDCCSGVCHLGHCH